MCTVLTEGWGGLEGRSILFRMADDAHRIVRAQPELKHLEIRSKLARDHRCIGVLLIIQS